MEHITPPTGDEIALNAKLIIIIIFYVVVILFELFNKIYAITYPYLL